MSGPPGYIPGRGRGAVGFSTRGDLGAPLQSRGAPRPRLMYRTGPATAGPAAGNGLRYATAVRCNARTAPAPSVEQVSTCPAPPPTLKETVDLSDLVSETAADAIRHLAAQLVCRYHSKDQCLKHVIDDRFHNQAAASPGSKKKNASASASSLSDRFQVCRSSVYGLKAALIQQTPEKQLLDRLLEELTEGQDCADLLCQMTVKRPHSIVDFRALIRRSLRLGVLGKANRRSAVLFTKLRLSTNAIGHAAWCGHADLLKLLVAVGHGRAGQAVCEGWGAAIAGDECIDWRCEQATSALHLAARAGNVECCRVLLQNGFDLCATDGSGQTPLQVAQTELVAGFLSLHRICPRGCCQYATEAEWGHHLRVHCEAIRKVRTFLCVLSRHSASLFSRDLVTRIFVLAGVDIAARWQVDNTIDMFE